jgi:hypothetical protein
MDKRPSGEPNIVSDIQELSAFCGTRSSLQCSQQPTTCPYPEPDQSTPRPPPLILDPFLILPNSS